MCEWLLIKNIFYSLGSLLIHIFTIESSPNSYLSQVPSCCSPLQARTYWTPILESSFRRCDTCVSTLISDFLPDYLLWSEIFTQYAVWVVHHQRLRVSNPGFEPFQRFVIYITSLVRTWGRHSFTSENLVRHWAYTRPHKALWGTVHHHIVSVH